MKVFVYYLILTISATTTLADSFGQDQLLELEAATSWSEARDLCRSYGSQWDLPVVSDITEARIPSEKLSKINYKTLDSEVTETYNLVWIRSAEESLNEQLMKTSEALVSYSNKKAIESLSITAERIEANKARLEQLNFSFEQLSRSSDDQYKLLNFLESYSNTKTGLRYPIDSDLPLAEQPIYIKMLPPSLFPDDILEILLKPSQRYLYLLIENLSYELDALSEGLPTICVQQN